MSQTMINVRGIGEETALLLASHGYVSPASLARSSVRQLSCVPGFGAIRAAAVIQAAGELVALSDVLHDVVEAEVTSSPGKKLNKKKADKKKADKKKADKKKADKKKTDKKKTDKKKTDKKKTDKKKTDKKKTDKKKADKKKRKK